MLIPSYVNDRIPSNTSLSRRVNANSQPVCAFMLLAYKLIKKGEC